jgi:hypothetical protein
MGSGFRELPKIYILESPQEYLAKTTLLEVLQRFILKYSKTSALKKQDYLMRTVLFHKWNLKVLVFINHFLKEVQDAIIFSVVSGCR